MYGSEDAGFPGLLYLVYFCRPATTSWVTHDSSIWFTPNITPFSWKWNIKIGFSLLVSLEHLEPKLLLGLLGSSVGQQFQHRLG